jgi:predicted TIM-barrel fold metal-dependent hydrolase
MPIIDAQVHIWRQGETLPPHRATPYLADEVIRDMDAAGIDAALVHPPSWDPTSNELARDAVAAYPDRFAILGSIHPDEPGARDRFDELRAWPGMLGFRFALLRPHQRTWLTDGTMEWVWKAADEAGLPVALLASDNLPLVGRVAERYPSLKLIVDHLGALHRKKGDEAFSTLGDLVALARYPNVAVKATGGPSYATDAYPFASLHAPYRAIIDAFGPRRVFWGTDITKMPCSWAQCVTHVTDIPWLSQEDKDLIMGQALLDWLGWKRG